MIPEPPDDLDRLRTQRRWRSVASALLVIVAFILLCGLITLLGSQNHRVAADQDLFHLPVVRQFAAQWPRPDLTNYASATAPGYHLLLAIVSKYVSDDVRVLRLVGGAFGVALIGVLAWTTRRRSAWLALPAAASVYVLTSTVWLLPENAAWLLVALALLLAMHATGRRLFVGSAIVLATLVFVRQSHAWTFAAFAAGAISQSRFAASYSLSRYAGRGVGRGSAADAVSAFRHSADPFPDYREKGQDRRLIAFTIFALIPAMAVLATLVAQWHGLTPPAFRPGSGVDLPMATKVGGFAPAAPAMVLALVGLFGTPLLAWLTPDFVDRRRVFRWLAIGLFVGFVLGVLPTSTYSYERRSGIWNLVEKLPTVAGRSPLIVLLATLGGAVAALALARLPVRQRLVLAVALGGFTLVQTANVLVWQRYYEPFVLLWLTLAAAWPTEMSPARRRLGDAGLAALTLFQLAVTAYTLRQAG